MKTELLTVGQSVSKLFFVDIVKWLFYTSTGSQAWIIEPHNKVSHFYEQPTELLKTIVLNFLHALALGEIQVDIITETHANYTINLCIGLCNEFVFKMIECWAFPSGSQRYTKRGSIRAACQQADFQLQVAKVILAQLNLSRRASRVE